MKLIKKFLILFFILSFLFLGSFALVGDWMETFFSFEKCSDWFLSLKPFAWLIGIGALVGDIILPLPATGIMAALGNVYGFWIGFLCSFLGSFSAGVIGYFITRLLGEKGARFFASKEEREEFKAVFDKFGGIAVIFSRMLPILPEVITVLAGFAKMRLKLFIPALILGTLPTAAFFSYLGTVGRENSNFGIIVAVFLPAMIWFIVSPFLKRKLSEEKENGVG
jgi:uncharacterized membrane protein YdjX (TVP38/TMEM64 family)